jgi:hypothetical protein
LTFAEWLGFQNLASLTIERGILHEFAEGCGPERLTFCFFSSKCCPAIAAATDVFT